MKNRFLAGLTRDAFMRRHWQKRPLLARDGLPSYAAGRGDLAISREALFDLARRDDVESRLILRSGKNWDVRYGPFTRAELDRMPRRNWTLLVQGVDQSLPQAARLLREFSFISYARLDDIMVSYAAPGGGVGPHYDSYDVFLVQGCGRRRWRIGRSGDLDLKPNLPLKILARFDPDEEWTVEPGDVLYLPPQYAHDGVAIDESITYSVGFRAPAAQELAGAFLDYLQDNAALDGRYADRGLEPTRTPGRIPVPVVDYAERMLDRLRWSRADVERFVGAYLTEPKNNVVFARPERALGAREFAARARAGGVRLALATRMLVSRGHAYINGERHPTGRAESAALAKLADDRELASGFGGTEALVALLHRWYESGYVVLAETETRQSARKPERAKRKLAA